MDETEENKNETSITMDKMNGNETTGSISMYLSFDADNTMSTAAFQTLDAMCNLSTASTLNMSNGETGNNSTLEAESDAIVLPTVKKMAEVAEQPPMATLLHKFPINILQKYKAASSTPTKEQLMRSVNISRGSDLGISFLGMDDEKGANFATATLDEDKENANPDSGDGSTLSSSFEVVTSLIEQKQTTLCTTVEELTLKNNKVMAQPVPQIIIDEPIIDCSDKGAEADEKAMPVQSVDGKPGKECSLEAMEGDAGFEDNAQEVGMEAMPVHSAVDTQAKESSLEAIADNMTIDDIGQEDGKKVLEQNSGNQSEIKKTTSETQQTEQKASSEPQPKMSLRRSITQPRAMAKTINEPAFLANYPRRKFSKAIDDPDDYLDNYPMHDIPKMVREPVMTDYRSFIKDGIEYDEEVANEIPKLMENMLKISSKKESAVPPSRRTIGGRVAGGGDSIDVGILKKLPPSHLLKPKPTNLKPRVSLLPPSQPDKRPKTLPNRMSTVVKTTLNSPARKGMRRSMMSASNAALVRRNVLESEVASQAKLGVPTRRSVMPSTRPSGSAAATTASRKLGTAALLNKRSTTAANRKSVFFGSKMPIASKPLPTRAELGQMFGDSSKSLASSKVEAVYTCNICASSFRIKSLLDAHKRSHGEGPGAGIFKPRASMAAKPSVTITPGAFTVGGFKCQYCDKKFAIARALHIHQMQHCAKIPPTERRKLVYTDLEHEGKAKLPAFSYAAPTQISRVSNAAGIMSGVLPPQSIIDDPYADMDLGSSKKWSDRNEANVFAKPTAPPPIASKIPQKLPLNLGDSDSSSMESLAKKKGLVNESTIPSVTPTATGNATASTGIATTSTGTGTTSRLKNSSAHAGVNRTPHKTIVCHKCKKTFKSIMEHIDHNMTMHPYAGSYGYIENDNDPLKTE